MGFVIDLVYVPTNTTLLAAAVLMQLLWIVKINTLMGSIGHGRREYYDEEATVQHAR